MIFFVGRYGKMKKNIVNDTIFYFSVGEIYHFFVRLYTNVLENIFQNRCSVET